MKTFSEFIGGGNNNIMIIKPLSKMEFDVQFHGKDYHIRREGNGWMLDRFDSSVASADMAHEDSEEFDSLGSALERILL